ncbi:hypothetical protein DSO57_1035053 [Entomophthora muscae]|uniref:Uncharacterized protein n=1 Tax=Entomophthora muscae TaxID=34485 RepID=A0ACC2UKA1_9FUNG|nr:hypothetical protein DSO57_1035053 [Entomophthora muscae]
MFASPPILTRHNATTSLSMAHATFDPLSLEDRPKLVRKKSGEVVKSALRLAMGPKSEARSVHFPRTLVRVRSFDKKLCPQSVSGYTPLGIRTLNFSTNAHLFDHMVVCLDKIERDPETEQVVGTVRVLNLDFQKKVMARYSFDNWESFLTVNATFAYTYNVSANHDAFEFRIDIPASMRISDDLNIRYCLKFAIQYTVLDQEHWDNNQGRNYAVEITPAVELDPELMDESKVVPPSPDNRSLAQERGQSPESFDPFKYAFTNSKSSLGNRYSLSSSLSKPTNPAPSKFGRSVKLESGKNSLSAPVYDATQLPPTTLYSSSPSNFSCSPVNSSSFGWAKAQSSWFDSITLEDIQARSPPVHSS